MKALFHQQGLTIVKRMSHHLLGVKISMNRSTYQHTTQVSKFLCLQYLQKADPKI